MGIGHAIGHHGELLQGTFRFGDDRPTMALITLPLPGLVTRAVFRPGVTSAAPGPVVTVLPPWKDKARAAVELVLREHVPGAPGGRLVLHGDDVPPGLGLGSSTSDVTAALRAIVGCYGLSLTPEDIARLAVRAEGASDSVMLDDRVVLFAQRRGLVLEEFEHELPPMIVVGCDTDPARGGINTLELPLPEHSAAELACFQVLLGLCRNALATGSVPLLAKVADASARINQRYLPTRGFALLRQICLDAHGLGVQVSHSGTVAGVIFDGAAPGAMQAASRCRRLMRRRGFAEPRILAVLPGGEQ
jgi:uncharacterized protein involved in propanediol utilization